MGGGKKQGALAGTCPPGALSKGNEAETRTRTGREGAEADKKREAELVVAEARTSRVMTGRAVSSGGWQMGYWNSAQLDL